MFRQINKIFCLLMLIISVGWSQKPGMNFKPEEPDVPFFYYDVVEYPMVDRDSVNIEIIIKVPFDAIQFIKKDNDYIGRYELSILLLDEDEVQTISRILTNEIKTQNFQETNSTEHFNVSKFTFHVLPSKFFLTIGVLDLDTRKSGFRKKDLDFKNYYSKPIVLSKINIIEKIIEGLNGEVEEIPSVIGSISDDSPNFFVTFTILSNGGKGSIRYIIYNLDNKVISEGKFDRECPKGLSKEKLTIPKEKMTFNRYRLEIIVKIGKDEAKSSRLFQIRWLGMSNLVDNLDMAIEQLKYIATSSEIKAMRKAKQDEKKELFNEFWKKRDPSPNTAENELMNEYYKRVQYSIEHFSGFMEGWKTDMGMVFILFGPPNDIERHPFEIQTKPYEIWYYYEINRTFVFMDETGFGDYRLISPYYDVLGNF